MVSPLPMRNAEMRCEAGCVTLSSTTAQHESNTQRGDRASSSVDSSPLTPSERAILCRTLRRIESLGLLEVNYGSQDIEATEVGLAIAAWINEHIEILGQDEYLLEWMKEEESCRLAEIPRIPAQT